MIPEHFEKTTVDFAYEIIEMDRELRELRCENTRLLDVEKEFNEFVYNSIQNQGKMMNNVVT